MPVPVQRRGTVLVFSLWILIVLTASSPRVAASNGPRAVVGVGTVGSVLSAESLEAWLDEFVDVHTGSDSPPLAVSVVGPDGPILEKGYGAVSPDRSVFRVASLSKVVTAAAVLQLVEREEVDLHEDIQAYLPELRLKTSGQQPVTLHGLLTHTSGIEDSLFGSIRPVSERAPELVLVFDERPPRIGHPAGEIVYSNTGPAVAGRVVEAVSGLSFDQYVERNLFAPLSMTRSTYEQPYPAALAPDVVPSGGDDVMFDLYPSGSMISTAQDMGRFMSMQLNQGVFQGRPVMSPGALKVMQAQQETGHPGMPGMAYGWMEQFINGERLLCHTGLSGHQSVLCLIPDQGLGLFMGLSVIQGGPLQGLRLNFVEEFMDRFLPTDPSNVPRNDSESHSLSVSGRYRPRLLSTTTVEKVGYMALDTSVSLTGSTIEVRLPPLGSEVVRAERIDQDLYRTDEGLYVGFSADRVDGAVHMYTSGRLTDPTSFYKIGWYQSGVLNAALAVAGIAAVLLSSAAILLGYVRRVVMRRDVESFGREPAWWWRTSVAMRWLVISAPVLVAGWFWMADPEARPLQVVSVLTISLIPIHLAAGIGLLLPVGAVQSWRRGWWSTKRRVGFSLMAILSLLSVLFLAYWQVLGFRI